MLSYFAIEQVHGKEARGSSIDCKQLNEGYHVDHSEGCRYFYYCSATGAKDTYMCPSGKLFDLSVSKCQLASSVQCNKDNNNNSNKKPKKEFSLFHENK